MPQEGVMKLLLTCTGVNVHWRRLVRDALGRDPLQWISSEEL